ncbi:MAG: hypothetical protein R3B90_04930 [Planctomycetaceae bacterium]
MSTLTLRRLAARCAAFSALTLLLAVTPTFAQTTDDANDVNNGSDDASVENEVVDRFPGKRIVRVEEDWLIDIGETTDGSSAPEVVTVFGPYDPNHGTHAVFEMNHSTYPDFAKGGMQLQAWWGNWFLGARRHYNGSELLRTVERIQFTVRTELVNTWSGTRLKLEIVNGDSVTYGNFGGEGYLRLRMYTNRNNLNYYDPDMSVEQSRVTFGANRVNRYIRTEVRYYTDAGEVITEEADRIVHQLAVANEAPAPITGDE